MEAAEDWQQQVDEVQALEAIYGDDFRVQAARGVPAQDGASSPGGWDAAALAALDMPPACTEQAGSSSSSGSWVLDCSLMVPVELPAGSLRLQLAEAPGGSAGGGSDPGPGPSNGSSGSCSAEANGASSTSVEGGRCRSGSAGGFAVRYLPPICVRLWLAPGYPSQRPPRVALSALWLSQQQVAALEQQLLALWGEQGPGAPICYCWADWLQSGALQHLGAAEALVLQGEEEEESTEEGSRVEQQQQQQQQEGSCCGNKAAAAAPAEAAAGGESEAEAAAGGAAGQHRGSAEEQLMKLLRYDAVREHQAFQAAQHTCGVCLEEQPGRAFVRLDCRHAWCQGCLAEQARIHVAEGSLERLRCPDPKCGAMLAPAVLQRLLSEEEYGRWEALTLQRTLDSMPDAAYCPRCGTLSLEDDSCAQCPKCLFAFCCLCLEGWHPGTQCVSAETKLAMLRRKMEGGGRAALDELRRREQELLSLAQIEKMAKQCPRCGMATQKAEGCNKITCGGCAAFWCWRCGKEIDGYRHFRSGECILFDEAEILRWEAQWEGMVAAAAAERVHLAGLRNELAADAARRRGGGRRVAPGCFCPQCGQINHKIGNNNMMQCWSCTSHFCYLCRSVLWGKRQQHFGPNGCKQHTPD